MTLDSAGLEASSPRHFKTPHTVRTPQTGFTAHNSAPGSNSLRRTPTLGFNLLNNTRRRLVLDHDVPPSTAEETRADLTSVCDDASDLDVSETEDDDILPYSSDAEDGGLTVKFRRLATKERQLLELKTEMKALMSRKKQMDRELAQLKMQIQRELEGAVQKSPSRTGRTSHNLDESTWSETGQYVSSLHQKQNDHQQQHTQAWYDKPLNFLQNIDTIVTNELEKLNMATTSNYTTNKNDADSNHDNNNTQHSATSGIWSFVNEIKASLLIDDHHHHLNNLNRQSNNRSSSENNTKQVHAQHSDEHQNQHETRNLIDLDSPKRVAGNARQMPVDNRRSDLFSSVNDLELLTEHSQVLTPSAKDNSVL